MIDVERFYKDYLNIEVPLSHQVEMWTEVCKGELPILLRAPTGSGKTEAVIAPFLNQFIENRFTLAPRLIYILPMRVLINSISRRIQTYAEKISPFISVELQHGDIPNSPFFISDIVVTTLDQFLYGFARTSHQVGYHLDVPAGSIASSLVVFDEAHMYRDPFTFSVMRALMEILYEGNIPFVVMTATMPKGLEMSLLRGFPIRP
jgi:CRISPR-associated endonuclease/helicase Cas3